jgi:hypothetical protein
MPDLPGSAISGISDDFAAFFRRGSPARPPHDKKLSSKRVSKLWQS